MGEKETMQWILDNLGEIIRRSIDDSKVINPELLYTPDWLAAMCYRETGFLIARYVGQGKRPEAIHQLMRGDYSQRPGEKEKDYHGFGYWQIDVASFPDFIISGNWKDPYKTCMKAIAVLEGKRKYLQKRTRITDEALHRAITAAYNCGEGNVMKVLDKGQDIDIRTHQHNYSAEVWRFRAIAQKILNNNL
jgi:hypothetical protein